MGDRELKVNLLDRYGISPDLSKRFSISFLDDFVDCSYRSFLGRFIKIPRSDEVNLPTTFGSGCHRGLARINKSLIEEREPCRKCPMNCKLNTDLKSKAMLTPIDKCEVKQIMDEEFKCEVDEDVKQQVLNTYIKKGDAAKGKEVVEALDRIGLACMSSALFERQPIGDILAVEQTVSGTLEGFGLLGVIDVVIGISGKSMIMDYKTTGQKPRLDKFPLRQLALYIYMIEQMELPVNGIAALYMLKKEPPKKPRKGSVFQQTFLNFFSLDKNREIYERTLKMIVEDMNSVNCAIANGVFIRNRNSMFCPCEYAEYCENTKKLDKFVSQNT